MQDLMSRTKPNTKLGLPLPLRPKIGRVVRTMVPFSSKARGPGVDLRFPFPQDPKVESTSDTTWGPQGFARLLSGPEGILV